MKNLVWISMLALTIGCASVPEGVKNDGQEAAERAKTKAKEAYRDLKKEM
jgi:hypothetical protein